MDKEQITKFIFGSVSNILKVQDFLDQNPTIDPREYVNDQKSNILHHLSFYDHRQLIRLYISHTAKLIRHNLQKSKALYKKNQQQQIAAWVNQKNVEGFTPILYASFNGHVDLIKDLEQYGANPNITNSNNLNVLHLAAQNNKVSTFIHFANKIDINVQDQKGNTPLHWAAYSGSEDVAAFLLSLPDAKLNLLDKQGQTPLILATIYGNTKIVRRLLLKGAKRSIKNNQGKKAIDIARQQQFANIERMLDNNYSFVDLFKFYYNVKIEYKPKFRKLTIPIVFLISTFCSIFITNSLISFQKNYVLIIELVTIVPMLLLYLSLLFPPKKYQKQDIRNYINQTRKICFQCLRRKPKRSYHCQICRVCISQYDHHCTWINNCVGKKNIARFIAFIFFLILSLAFIGFVSFLMLLRMHTQIKWLQNQLQFRKTQLDDVIAKLIRTSLLIINLIISAFFFPVLLLFIVQLKNLCLNKTTYERIRGQNTSVKDQLKGKNKGGIIKNCKAMCSKTRQSFITTSDDSFKEQLISA